MEQKAVGTVIEAKNQWWMKINRKPVRSHALDGAEFPSIIKVKYSVDRRDYVKRKWVDAGCPVPDVGSSLPVVFFVENPNKAKILL